MLLAAHADGIEIEIAGRLAARVGSGLLTDVVEVQEGGEGSTRSSVAFTVEARSR